MSKEFILTEKEYKKRLIDQEYISKSDEEWKKNLENYDTKYITSIDLSSQMIQVLRNISFFKLNNLSLSPICCLLAAGCACFAEVPSEANN